MFNPNCPKIDNFIKVGTCLFGPHRIKQLAGSFRDDGPKPTGTLTSSICCSQCDPLNIRRVIMHGFKSKTFLRNLISDASKLALLCPQNAGIYIAMAYLDAFYTAYALKCIYYSGPDASIRDFRVVNAPKTDHLDYEDYISRCLDYIDDIRAAHPEDRLSEKELDKAIDELFKCSPRRFCDQASERSATQGA